MYGAFCYVSRYQSQCFLWQTRSRCVDTSKDSSLGGLWDIIAPRGSFGGGTWWVWGARSIPPKRTRFSPRAFLETRHFWVRISSGGGLGRFSVAISGRRVFSLEGSRLHIRFEPCFSAAPGCTLELNTGTNTIVNAYAQVRGHTCIKACGYVIFMHNRCKTCTYYSGSACE